MHGLQNIGLSDNRVVRISGIGRVADFRVSGSSGNENFGYFSGNCDSFSGTRHFVHYSL